MPPLKCSAKDCFSSGALTPGVPMFKFPRDLDRCGVWVKNAGNETLLHGPSRKLCVRKHLCAEHFEEDQFFDRYRRRLRRTAIPSVFTSEPLSDKAMANFPVFEKGEPDVSNAGGNCSGISSLLKKYNSFSIPCSTVSEYVAQPETSKHLHTIQKEVKVSKAVEEATMMNSKLKMPSNNPSVKYSENEELLLSVIKIPCESSTSCVDSIVPGPGSVTYIEGPWSNPSAENQPFSVQIFYDTDTARQIFAQGRCAEYCAEQNVQKIVVHHVKIETDDGDDPDLTLPSLSPKETESLQCDDFPTSGCHQISSGTNCLSASSLEKRFVIQSKQLINGAQVRVIYNAPAEFKHQEKWS